jgi:hypothetical protein
MIGPQPGPAARCLIAMTIVVLPADARDRYREEFRTELCELGLIAQIGVAASLLRGSIFLRRALMEREMITTEPRRVDWRCHLGRHHYVRKVDDNPDVHGQTYLECTRCGRHEDGPPVKPPLGPRAAGMAFPGIG